MILSLRVPDELYAHYAQRNPKNPNAELEKALRVFKNLDPDGQTLFLDGEALREVKEILDHPVSTVEELLAHLRKWSRVRFPEDGLEVKLTAEQRQKLQSQSSFWAQSYKDFLTHQFQAALSRVIG